MNRLTAPLVPNTGKNVSRHLGRAELKLVADYLRTHSKAEARAHFGGISLGPINRACAIFKVVPPKHPRLDLAAIAAVAATMSIADAAARCRCAESTVTRAKRLYPQTKAAA